MSSASPVHLIYVRLLYFLPLSSAPAQFSTSVALTAPMEAPLQAQFGAPLEPLGFGLPTKPLGHMDPESGLNTDHDYLLGSQFPPNGSSATESSAASSTSTFIPEGGEEEEECLVDSQPICFKENPFLVANRKGKGRPPGEQILSGPPVGYGRQGQLQPWLFSKARSLRVVWRQHVVLLWRLSCCSLVSFEMDRKTPEEWDPRKCLSPVP